MASTGVPGFYAVMEKPFVNLYIGIHYGFDKLKYNPMEAMNKIGARPLLLMHSTEDSQVPYHSFERLLDRAQAANANVTTFTRDGDEHFICYEKYFENPADDKDFSKALIDFLNSNFG